MSGWNIPQQDVDVCAIDDTIPEPPKPMETTVLVDLATEAEAPKTYVAQEGDRKLKDVRKEEGIKTYAPPVDVYEPGFRSDLYEGLVEFFKRKRETRDRIEALRKKIGLR